MCDPNDEVCAVVTVPVLMSLEAAAKVLGSRSARTVQRRIDAGLLRAVIENGRTMVRGDDLLAYIESLQPYEKDRASVRARRPERRQRRTGTGKFDFLHE